MKIQIQAGLSLEYPAAEQETAAIAYASVRVYWLVRYIEATHPGLLKASFAGGG